MATLYVVSGRPSVGKTTYLKNHYEGGANLEYVFLDMFRREGHKEDDCIVRLKMYQYIHALMKRGVSVIVDGSAPTETSREQYLDWFPEFNKYVLIYFFGSYEICKYNNDQRKSGDRLPEAAFQQAFCRYRQPLDDKSLKRWDEVQVFANNDNVMGVKEIIYPKTEISYGRGKRTDCLN
jgi:tRNA uridine 5-carbamoylmethylation protein Kti12